MGGTENGDSLHVLGAYIANVLCKAVIRRGWGYDEDDGVRKGRLERCVAPGRHAVLRRRRG